jgi:putative ABC transport system permease protein
VTTLRDAQLIAGRPHKVTMYAIKLNDSSQAAILVDKINDEIPDVHAALSGEFAEQMPDFESSEMMINGISFMAIFIGGVGVLNTMLMSVYERTREIGVLRSLGWRRRMVLGLILREAILLGLLGGATGIFIALGLNAMISLIPSYGEMITPLWELEMLARAIGVALLLGVLGGLYPAYRATRLQPVEALRYE